MTHFGSRDPIGRVRRLFTDGADGAGPRPAGERDVLVVGHRGAPRERPENTIDSFRRAIELGAAAIETDVCVTRDDAYVLWHDNDPGDPVSLARDSGAEDLAWLANWPGVLDGRRRPVHEMTLAEMRERCGYSRNRRALAALDGESPPEVPFALLDDLLGWAAGEPRLREIFLDIKLRPEDGPRLGPLAQAVQASMRRPDLVVNLLLPHVELWRALEGAAPLPALRPVPDFELPRVLDGAEAVGARRVSMGYTVRRTWGDFERELADVLAARDAGRLDSVVVWTLNDAARLRALIDAGVDAILTDDVPLLRSLLA